MKQAFLRFGLPIFIVSALAFVPTLLESLGLEGRSLRSELRFLTLVVIWSLYALSYNIAYGFTGLFSLGHAIFLGTGALTAAIATSTWGLTLWPALGLSLLASTIVSLLIGWLSARVNGVQFAVITAALSLAIYLLVINFSEVTGGLSGMRIPRESLNLGVADLSLLQRDVAYIFALVGLGAVYLAYKWFMGTPLGTSFKYIRENEDKAGLIGYNSMRIRWISFTISGIVAGFAGALYAFTQGSMDANLFHWSQSINALIWVVVGGMGSLIGPILGVSFLQGIEHLFGELLPVNSLILGGILVLLAVKFAPNGIAGIFQRGSKL